MQRWRQRRKINLEKKLAEQEERRQRLHKEIDQWRQEKLLQEKERHKVTNDIAIPVPGYSTSH